MAIGSDTELPRMGVTPHRDRLLFLHVPKTAGMSLRDYLRTQYRAAAIAPAENWRDFFRAGLDPGAYALFAGHFRYNFLQVLPPATRTLTVLRDPVDRHVSALRHARRDPRFDRKHHQLKSLSIADAIRHPVFGPGGANAQTGWLSASADVASIMALWEARPLADADDAEPSDPWEDRFQRAAKNLRHVDFIGLYEQLPVALEDLCRRMGFHPPVALPVVNVAPDEPLDLTNEDVAIIRKLNEQDVELYARAKEIGATNRRLRTVIDLAKNGFYQIPLGSFAINLSEPMPGDGWLAAETDGGTVWRWTDASLATSLDLPRAPAGGAICRISFFRWAHAGDVAFAVSVNGADRPHTLDATAEHSVLTFAVDEAAAPWACCSIRLATTGNRPPQSEGEDKRSLGIPVFRIEFLAAAPPPAA